MKGFLVFLLIVLFAVTASAQWTFVKVFPDTNLSWPSGINNGIAVDPDGKIWLQSYSGGVDSFFGGTPQVKLYGVIRVYNPNGTEAAFSPIKTITVNSVTDTITGSGYGLAVDKDGNIISVKPSNTLYRLNYKTGAGMTKKLNPIPGYTSSLVTPAVDAAGELVVGAVSPGFGSIVLNADFSSAGTTVKDTVLGFGRSLAVSSDAKEVYLPRFDYRSVWHYHSANGSLGPYTFADTLMKGLVVENSVIDKKNGYLWVTSGNVTSGMPDSGKYSGYTEYAYNVTTAKIVDSIKWNGSIAADPRPRGIAFSKTGDTAYVAVFNAGKSFVQMFKRGSSGVKAEPGVVATSYSLSQNYPNPFNPSTEIKFSLSNGGQTTLRVYDVLGREVSTLVNERLNTGAYSVTFDASKIPSGTYFYTLNVDGHQISKKMMLLK